MQQGANLIEFSVAGRFHGQCMQGELRGRAGKETDAQVLEDLALHRILADRGAIDVGAIGFVADYQSLRRHNLQQLEDGGVAGRPFHIQSVVNLPHRCRLLLPENAEKLEAADVAVLSALIKDGRDALEKEDDTLVSSLSSSIEKGESLKDTGLTLRALGAEAIILRHNSSGAAWLLEESTRLPVINAGDGMHEHPTQALLDLRTILTHLRPGLAGIAPDTLAGVTVMITGDILHSRVARSNMQLLPRVGARVLLCGPKELLPEQAARSGPGIEIERDFDAALAQSQAVMMLRIQAERLAGLQLDLDEYKANYQLTGQRLATHAPTAVVLHPGPIIRGMEISAGVADGVQSAILEQVTNGLAVRMAVLFLVNGGKTPLE